MPDSNFPPLIAIYGCTGVGKSAYAIHAAQLIGGEIINADSRYLYRDITIGVSKPTHEERQLVRHHVIDVLAPTDLSSVSNVQAMAYSAINQVIESGRTPLLVGGTPLYMNAITEGWQIPEVAPDWEFRTLMERRLASEGLEVLSTELEAIDPIAAARTKRNPRRLVRALEIHHVTGKCMSSLESRQPPPYRTLSIALCLDRESLYERIDNRINTMIDQGLVDEVLGLLEDGLTGAEPAFSAIGYRQLLPYINGDVSLADAVDMIKRATHRYVRHQMTWMRKKTDLVQVNTGSPHWIEDADLLIGTHLATRPGRDP